MTGSYEYIGIIKPENQMIDMDYNGWGTFVEPLPQDPRFDIKWFPSSNEWFYVEKRLEPNQTENPMDKIMTYVDLRKMNYPPETEFLDAYVKNDIQQMNQYTSNCLIVKQKFPKDMTPITLRDYYLESGIIKSSQ